MVQLRELGSLERFVAALASFEIVSPNMTLRDLKGFAIIAGRPGITQAELMREADYSSQGVTSSVVQRLGAGESRTNKPGLGLIESYGAPVDARLARYRLSQRGRIVASKVGSVLGR